MLYGSGLWVSEPPNARINGLSLERCSLYFRASAMRVTFDTTATPPGRVDAFVVAHRASSRGVSLHN
jgi:hypothetical protein